VTADLPEDLTAVIRRLRMAYEEAHALTTAIDEPRAGFAAATQLSEVLQVMLDEVAEMRALIVAQIYDTKTASLAEIAERFGVSKSRADQLVRRGRAATTREGKE
jgi:DNA-directed RNA polymerase specialized sigma subunit